MSWFATNLISAFLPPPLNLLLAALLGLLLTRTYPRLGRTLLLSSLALLWLCSTPYFAEGALRLLEGPPKAVDAQAHLSGHPRLAHTARRQVIPGHWV